MKSPINIAVTGATGQICYSLLFRIAAGDMLGKDKPVILRLYDIAQVQSHLIGIVMELQDCAFPLLKEVITTDDPRVAFDQADIAILVGALPRTGKMERKDLLEANAPIFLEQGKALNEVANRDIKVLVVGNPANTNAYITMKYAPKLKPENFSAMLQLDHNRAVTQVAQKLKQPVTNIRKIIIWGNHSNTQYPDLSHAIIGDKKAVDLISDQHWIEKEFVPTVQKRGMAIIEARQGLSSAASAANAIINHINSWVLGTRENDWTSMGILSDGSYGIPEDIIYSFPVTCHEGKYRIVQDLEISNSDKSYMAKSYQELLTEKEAVQQFLVNISCQ